MSIARTSCLLVALILGAGCNRGSDKPKLPPATGSGAPSLPMLATGSAADTAERVAATEGKTTGTLFPHAEAQIATKAGGIIERIYFDEGARVKKGDVLVRMDARDAALRLEQAKTALEAARVSVKAIKLEHARSQTLLDQNALPRAQWEQVDARYQAALVGVKQAEAAMAVAAKSVSDAVVRAPMNAVVTAKLKSEGEMATTMPPTIVLVLQDQETLDLRFRLPERALASIKAGDTFIATFSSVGVRKEAKITRINPTVDARTRTIELVAELPNRDLVLKPGLLAEIELDAKLGSESVPAAGKGTSAPAAPPPAPQPPAVPASTPPAAAGPQPPSGTTARASDGAQP